MNEPKSNSVNHSDTLTEQNNSESKPWFGNPVGQMIDSEWSFNIDDIIHEKTDARRRFNNFDWSKTTVTNKDKPTHVNFDHTINLMEYAGEEINLKHEDQSPNIVEMSGQQFLNLIQITNSNFPIGSFSHSFGIETYIRKNYVHNGKTLKSAIKSYIFGQFLYLDLLGIKGVYQALDDKNFDQVWEIDRLSHASGMSKETVDGARRIGTQMVKIYRELFPECHVLATYQEKIKGGECSGVPGVAFGIMAYHLKVQLKTALYAHLFSSTSAQIQNAVRAIPLGQVEGQKVMMATKAEYFDQIVQIALDANFDTEFCRNAPGFEIAQMEHEETNIRLFMS